MNFLCCTGCQSRYQFNPESPPKQMVCPRCKAALEIEKVQAKPKPRTAVEDEAAEEVSEKAKPSVGIPETRDERRGNEKPRSRTKEEPLSLDDDVEPRDTDDERSANESSFPVGLIVAGVVAVVLLAAGGGVAAWFLLREPDRAELEVVETSAPEEKQPADKPNTKNPDSKPSNTDEQAPPKSGTQRSSSASARGGTGVSPAVLLARAKTGDSLQRVEAIDQLGRLGVKAQLAVPDLIVLLDDADDGVRRTAADALERIGPSAKADAACIPRALAGSARYGRLFALKYYSKVETATAEQLPLIAKALDDSDLATRDQALSALERVGPTGKAVAFPALLRHVIDSDALFAARVAKVLSSFAPYDGAERKLLVENLRHTTWQQRRLAAMLLAPGATDESAASALFEPLLKDVSPEVRAVALPALAKWPAAMKRLQPALISLIRDDHADVRTAAIRALGQYGAGAEAKNALLGLTVPSAAAETRILAVQSLLAMTYDDAKSDLPILAALIKMDDAKVMAGAFGKAAGLKAEAKELLPQIGDGLKHSDSAVQVAALKLAGAIGPDAGALTPRVSALLLASSGSKPAEAVQAQAAATLQQLGPAAKDALLEAMAAPLPAPVLKRVFESLGRKGTEVPAKMFPQLFIQAERTAELRPAIAELVARIGGDDIARLCADRTYWSFKTLKNGQKVKECKFSLEVQVWAIETMGQLDPKGMTEKGRTILIERMKSLPKTNPDLECRKAAEAASAKLIAAGLGDKP
jgi:HEAT repeat protein